MTCCRRFVIFVLLSAIAAAVVCACSPLVPAKTPPQLKHTPGAYVVVTEERFEAGLFVLEYPRSWRVVKASTADSEQMQVYFVAPDGGVVSLTQVDAIAPSQERHVNLANGLILQIAVERAAEPAPSFASHAEALIASIRER